MFKGLTAGLIPAWDNLVRVFQLRVSVLAHNLPFDRSIPHRRDVIKYFKEPSLGAGQKMEAMKPQSHFRPVRKLVKNDYWLRHVCPFVCIIIIFYLLQLGCNPVAVVMLHVYKHEYYMYTKHVNCLQISVV